MRRLIPVLSVAVLLASCTRDNEFDIDNPDSQGPIRITASDVAVTRGTPINSQADMTSMGVFCSFTDTDDWTASAALGHMFNQKLTYTAGEWEYPAGEEVYWEAADLTQRYTFFAYAPYGSGVYNAAGNPTGNGIVVNGSSASTGTPTLTYTVPVEVENQPDLMVAVPKKNVRPTGAEVALTMKHALTSVAFQIAGNGEKVKSIAIQGISTTGTLSIDGGTISWSSLGAATDVDFSASLNYDADQTYYTATEDMSTSLIKGDGYLMMIPQTLTAGATVVVTYSDDTTKELALATRTWAAGDRVTYNITLLPDIDGGEADILYFDTSDNNRLSIGRWGVDVTDIEEMVFTRFGSVIGFTNAGTTWNTRYILFNPTATAGYGEYTSIPNYDAWNSTTPASSPSVSDPAYHNGTNILAGRGDICKLVGLTSTEAKAMTARQLSDYKSGWRLPTLEENRVFIGTTPNDPTTSFDNSSGYYTWTAVSSSEPGTGTFPKNKYYSAGNDVSLPAAGSRNTYDGSVSNLDTNGYYWSSTALSGSDGYSLNFYRSLVGPSYSSSRAFGFANRCVHE